MSVKVGMIFQVLEMDSSEIITCSKITTVVNPNPRDPTAQFPLTKSAAESLMAEVGAEMQEKLDELEQSVYRNFGG